MKKINLDWIIILFFIVGIIFNTVKTSVFHFHIYGYFFSILSSLLIIVRFKCVKKLTIYTYFLFLTLSLLYPILFLHSFPNLDSYQYLIMVSPCFFIPYYFNGNCFSEKAVKIIVYYSLICVLFYFIGIGVDYSYGSVARMQGFMSEPSAWGVIASIIVLYGILNRNIMMIILYIIVIILTASPMTIIISFFAMVVYFFVKIKIMARLLFLVPCLLLFAYAMHYFTNNTFDNPILHRMSNGVIYIFTLGKEGYNPRFESLINMINFMVEKGGLYTGFGVHQSSFFESATGSISAFNIWMDLIFSFGVIGFLIYFFLSLFIVLRSYENNYLKVMLISTFSYTLFNSAQGITIQVLFFIMIIFSIIESFTINQKINV